MFSKHQYIPIVLFVLLSIEFALGNDLCELKDNCEECLAENYLCAWCTHKDFEGSSRCMTKANLLRENCFPPNIIENEEKFEIVKDNPTQDYKMDAEKQTAEAIQLRPQKLKMKLVKGRPQQFKLTYRMSENYPFDLYFLMDLTISMKDDKDTLTHLSRDLATTLTELTENYRIGFGSFADKPGMPIDPSQKFKEDPCSYQDDSLSCKPTYDFRHHLQLTTDIEAFSRTVNESEITANFDNLEGQLDALMQVIVCTDQIGWSENARKIVILATDGLVHMAGDGLLLGLTQKNDKKCHLNQDGFYDGDLTFDYPSIEEIYWELLRRKINVIFAVVEDVYPYYVSMSDLMKEVSSTEMLSANSSNILDLVRNAYASVVNKVQLEDISPDIISVQYFTNCGDPNAPVEEKNFCKNLILGKEIDFHINVTLNEYPRDDNWTQSIKIEVPGLSESLEIAVEIQKPCPCNEQPIKDDTGRVRCNDHGHLKCGMCICDENWVGVQCSCDSSNFTTYKALENQCRLPFPNKQLGEICSNHGECDCGKCQCSPQYEGKYCECQKCPPCNEETQICQCGGCICKYGWTDGKCCIKAKDGCVNPHDNKSICSGNGSCDTCSDTCVCDKNFLGKYCQYSPSGLCDNYTACAISICEDPQNIELNCSGENEAEYSYEVVHEDFDTNQKCCFELNSTQACENYFEYKIGESEQIHLKIMHKVYTEPPDVAMISLTLFFITCFLGFLILILVKVVIIAKERKEFKEFDAIASKMQADLKEGNRCETNPLYRDPVTHYSMPKLDDDQ